MSFRKEIRDFWNDIRMDSMKQEAVESEDYINDYDTNYDLMEEYSEDAILKEQPISYNSTTGALATIVLLFFNLRTRYLPWNLSFFVRG